MARLVSLAALIAVVVAPARPVPAGPATPWDLRPLLISGVRRGEFVLRLSPDQGAAEWMLPRKGIRLAVLDHRGAPVQAPARLELAPGVAEIIRPLDPQRFVDVPLWFDPGGLSPALYALQAHLSDVDAFEAATGRALRVPEARDVLRVNVPPPSRRSPALSPGQGFLFVTPRQWNLTPRPNTFRDEGAAPVPWGDLELRVLRLDRIAHERGGDRFLWFSVDGRRGRLRLPQTGDVSSLPNLYPLVEDAHLDALRAKFEGRTVWAYGGFQVHCATGDPIATGGLWTRASSSATIRAILRVHAGGIEIGAGGLRPIDLSPQAFSALDPLVVVFASGGDFKPAASYSGVAPGARRPPGVLKTCPTMFQMHGDAWDFERTYSLQPPWRMHPDWPTAMLRAVLDDRIMIGMTHDMVAWTRGWPMEYGTPAALRAMPVWEYDAVAPPARFWVRFQGDRVVRFGTGRPP